MDQAKKQAQRTPPAREPAGLQRDNKGLALRFWRRWLSDHIVRLAFGVGLSVLFAVTAAAYPELIRVTLGHLEDPQASEPLARLNKFLAGLELGLGPAGPADFVWLMAAFAVAVAFAKGAAYLAQTVVISGVIMRVIAQVQEALFAHLLRADLARLTSEAAGNLITRFTNDVNALRNALTKLITNGLRDAVTAMALVAYLIYLDWLLALIVLVIYPLAFWPIIVIGRRLRRLARNTQAHMGDMTSVLYESLTGARMVKAYGLEANEQRRALAAFERMYRLWMKNVHYKARLEPMLEVLGGVAVAGVIAFSGWRITTGGWHVNDLVAFIAALLWLAKNVQALGSLNAVMQEGLAAVQRIFEVLDEAPKIADVPKAKPLRVRKGEIAFDHVSFAYGEDAPALADFSLTVPGGQTVALVGRSGAGKSTIFNLVPRFYEPDRGRILIDGQDIRSVTMSSLRGAMALVSQDVTLFNDTVAANIAFGRLDAGREEIEEAARAAAAHDFIMRLPEGYDTIVGDRGFRLSGGERQRIALARAVLRNAPILLLDEATSALDSESERLVQNSLEALSRGRTTLVIAHRLATVRKADRIVVLDRGRIVETGAHEELMARDGLYTQLCRLQLLDEPTAPAAEAAEA